MARVIDLSHTIVNNMPVFPGDEPVRLSQIRYLNADHFNDHRLEISMHAGTHIDGPMHLTESRTFISEIAPESFIGPGCLLDVRGRAVISLQDQFEEIVKENSIVLLFTGHDRFYGQPQYFENYPIVDEALCHFLIQKRIKMIGMDTPSPDTSPFLIHKLLLKNGICVLENLTHLEQLVEVKGFELTALPLNIQANGSMARAIARVI